MKKTLFEVMAAAVFILSVSACAVAQPEYDGPSNASRNGHDREAMFDKMVKDLGLSDAQSAEIKKIKEANHERIKPLKEQLKAKRQELKSALDDQRTDRDRIAAIVSEISSVTRQILELRVDSVLSLKGILTPEQFKKMQENREKRKSGIGSKKHWGMGDKEDDL